MEIRNITKEDLPKLAELISCEELATRDDICFEHSKLMTDSLYYEEEIVSFVIIRQYSLNEFFNGKIPLWIGDKNDKDYEDGNKYWLIETLDEFFAPNIQYELLYAYSRQNHCVSELYNHVRITDNCILGFLWSTSHNPYMPDELKGTYFRKYNDDFLYDLLPFY